MASCAYCKREMTDHVGCTVNKCMSEGRDLDRMRFGEELRFPGGFASGHCPDCGCGYMEFHHPGCDIEECPVCGGQMISCECVDHWIIEEVLTEG